MMTEEITETKQEQVYRVPDLNLGNLQDRIAKLAKRAVKLGVGMVCIEVLGHEDVPIKDEDGSPTGRLRRWYQVKVIGSNPHFNGWSFQGSIEHAGEAGNIVRGVPGSGELPHEYRESKPTCDHCQLIRNRVETFVLKHENGTWKRVGRQCLKDFLGHADPHLLAQFAQILIDAASAGEASEDDFEGGCGGGQDYFDLEEVLKATSAAIRVSGWMSNAKANDFGRQSTSGLVIELLTNPKMEGRDKFMRNEQDARDAAATMEWVKTLPELADLNDYMYNLSVLGKVFAIKRKEFGLACSMIATYLREQDRELYQKKARAESHHVGEVGKRQEFTLELLNALEIDNDGRFGPSTMYKFTDATGNRFIWFASGSYPLGDVMAGATLKILATVKKHDEYQGIKQTLLSRCKVLERHDPPTSVAVDQEYIGK